MRSKITYFAPRDPGYVIDISGAAVLKSSKHNAAAQKLVAYLVSRRGQDVIADSGYKRGQSTSFEYPIASAVTTKAPEKPFQDLRPYPMTMAELGTGAEAVSLLKQAELPRDRAGQGVPPGDAQAHRTRPGSGILPRVPFLRDRADGDVGPHPDGGADACDAVLGVPAKPLLRPGRPVCTGDHRNCRLPLLRAPPTCSDASSTASRLARALPKANPSPPRHPAERRPAHLGLGTCAHFSGRGWAISRPHPCPAHHAGVVSSRAGQTPAHGRHGRHAPSPCLPSRTTETGGKLWNYGNRKARWAKP